MVEGRLWTAVGPEAARCRMLSQVSPAVGDDVTIHKGGYVMARPLSADSSELSVLNEVR